MIKILIINDDFPPESKGGAGVVAFNLALKLKELGHDILVASTTQNKEFAGQAKFEGIPIFRWYCNYSGYFKRSYVRLINFPILSHL